MKLDNLEEKDKYGRTAFHYACLRGNLDCVKILMKYNININAQDNNGETAFILSCKNGYRNY